MKNIKTLWYTSLATKQALAETFSRNTTWLKPQVSQFWSLHRTRLSKTNLFSTSVVSSKCFMENSHHRTASIWNFKVSLFLLLSVTIRKLETPSFLRARTLLLCFLSREYGLFQIGRRTWSTERTFFEYQLITFLCSSFFLTLSTRPLWLQMMVQSSSRLFLLLPLAKLLRTRSFFRLISLRFPNKAPFCPILSFDVFIPPFFQAVIVASFHVLFY